MPEEKKEQKSPLWPAISAALRFFTWQHLQNPKAQDISRKFAELADEVAKGPQNREAVKALDRLLEAKDAAVRAVLLGDS